METLTLEQALAELVAIRNALGEYCTNSVSLAYCVTELRNGYKSQLEAKNILEGDSTMTQRTVTFDPSTHRIVPVEPTQKMLNEAWDKMVYRTELLASYQAMLAASPEAPDVPTTKDVEPVNKQLLEALKHILETVPAQQDGGGFIVDHHSPDGDYIGSQNIDPMWVVQEMASIAFAAIAAAEQA